MTDHPEEDDGNLSSYADVVRINTVHANNPDINNLGGNLLRIRKRHPCVDFLIISARCLQTLEIAVGEIDEDDNANAWFRNELGFSGILEEDVRKLGADLAHCPNLKRIDITTDNIIQDEYYTSLFEEASTSTSIKTVVFKKCKIYRSDPVSHLFSLTNLREVIFKSCCISASFIDVLGEHEDDLQHWNIVRFVDCQFNTRRVGADVVTMLTTMSELRHVEFKNSGLGSNAVRILLRHVRDHHNVSVRLEN